jgi:hypothetical protein
MQIEIQNYSNLIHQLINHLNQVPEKGYSQKLSILGGSTVGEHVRHIYNFPECLLEGIKTGIVNYDKRRRNLPIETNREYAVRLLLEQVDSLANYDDKPLILETGNDTALSSMDTNVKRELHYITEHTIHHMAIIRIGFSVNFPEMDLDKTFGFAYSTIHYKRQVFE